MSVLLALLLQAPAIVTAVPRAPGDAGSGAPFTVEVDASAGGQPLWHGTLRLTTRNSASYNQMLTQGRGGDCDTPNDASNDRFNVALNRFRNGGEALPTINYSIGWTRPSQDCGPGPDERTVQMSGRAELVAGKTITLSGDGGLVVRLTPRAAR